MKNNRLKILIFAAIVVIAGALLIWKFADNNSNNQSSNQTAVQPPKQKQISYDGVAGQNALALLKQKYRVQTKDYKGIGELVTSIDGVQADGQHFWSFYVNGKQAQVGAGSYTTKSGDKITWKLEAIK